MKFKIGDKAERINYDAGSMKVGEINIVKYVDEDFVILEKSDWKHDPKNLRYPIDLRTIIKSIVRD